MGTNYYLQHEVNVEGRIRDMHICKCSGGWSPSLVGYNKKINTWHDFNIMSWFEWKLFLKERISYNNGKIFNEYEELLTYTEFIRKIEDHAISPHGKTLQNHARSALDGEFGNLYKTEYTSEEKKLREAAYWVDPEGYSFHDGEFS